MTPVIIFSLVIAIIAVAMAVFFALKANGVAARKRELEVRISKLAQYEAIEDAQGHAAGIENDAKARAASIEKDALAGAQEVEAAAKARADSVMALATAKANDLSAQATALLTAATTEAHAVKAAAVAKLDSAKSDYAALQERAAADAKDLRQKAEQIMSSARLEANCIIELAQKRGVEIAGEALEAKGRADQYAATAEAMKNVIEGYGDRYIVPTFSLLDDLADEFGFAEGGQKLKEARARTRRMIKDEVAAACDYVEAVRKNTAIDFVLDAFNGKVDTILADVRHDNFGTLEQKVNDAFALVNHNGAAFRNARITPEYLSARLDELKWAVVVNELKLKDREEQRAIKERIREEEKAQREYERAMKEAAKEEETLKKLREKVEQEMAQASEAQKAKFEKQLAEVNERLRIAEEKNQRALSMAQQTRAGHVYVISNVGSFGENVFKIGLTRRLEPLDRIHELGDASVPFEFDVHALIRSDDAPTLERALHKKFIQGQINKVNVRKEFFRAALHDIRAEVDKLGSEASWTMTAEATEYRETVAIEAALKAKTLDAKEWAARQIAQEAGPLVMESIEGAA